MLTVPVSQMFFFPLQHNEGLDMYIQFRLSDHDYVQV